MNFCSLPDLHARSHCSVLAFLLGLELNEFLCASTKLAFYKCPRRKD